MADVVNPTAQTKRQNSESDVSNGELKQFILDMKQEIMSKFDENQQELKEMRDEVKALKTMVGMLKKKPVIMLLDLMTWNRKP